MAESADLPLDVPDEPAVLLAAIDASDSASRVVTMAARLTRLHPKTTLHLVHVFRPATLDRPAPEAGSRAQLVDEAREFLQHHLRMARRQCNVSVVDHFVIGEPTTEIVELAKKLNSDVLIIGTHETTAFERLLLGSVAESILRRAGCSVVVVRPRSHEL